MAFYACKAFRIEKNIFVFMSLNYVFIKHLTKIPKFCNVNTNYEKSKKNNTLKF